MKVGIIMGSDSDLKIMQQAEAVLHEALGIVLSEEHLLAVAEKEGVLGAVFLVGEL